MRLVFCIGVALALAGSAAADKTMLVTWARIPAKRARASTSRGWISHRGTLTAPTWPPDASPSFLAVHPNRNFLYAVSEVGKFDGKKSGSVSAFSIDAKSGS